MIKEHATATGIVQTARNVGDQLRLLVKPESGKTVIAVSPLLRDSIGRIFKPRKGTLVNIFGELIAEGDTTMVLANCAITPLKIGSTGP